MDGPGAPWFKCSHIEVFCSHKDSPHRPHTVSTDLRGAAPRVVTGVCARVTGIGTQHPSVPPAQPRGLSRVPYADTPQEAPVSRGFCLPQTSRKGSLSALAPVWTQAAANTLPLGAREPGYTLRGVLGERRARVRLYRVCQILSGGTAGEESVLQSPNTCWLFLFESSRPVGSSGFHLHFPDDQ